MTHVLIALCLLAQGDDEAKKKEEAVKKRLEKLFEIAKGDDWSKAAPYIVYRGEDEKRNRWKEVCDYEKDKKYVDEICREIKGFLKDHDSYEIGKFKMKKESEGVWHSLEVTFKKGDTTKKKIFAFLKIKDDYALGDID